MANEMGPWGGWGDGGDEEEKKQVGKEVEPTREAQKEAQKVIQDAAGGYESQRIDPREIPEPDLDLLPEAEMPEAPLGALPPTEGGEFEPTWPEEPADPADIPEPGAEFTTMVGEPDERLTFMEKIQQEPWRTKSESLWDVMKEYRERAAADALAREAADADEGV
jgi:hypothetical protein